ncbi:hypothetical protein FE257_008788 [Aspergillus nanangensis]|uniref:Uncharacterized protein n=1 Tax=Aspergillus nanangensis TaxID=2582783 RepID=A0AAD4GT77_ASPNN|nr:hypothetical protein FE257_008788 [Aspergillus nanangensis]
MDSPLVSPAKARQAAIQAKDWAYVNSWLSRQYAPNPIPAFERNEDTLRSLLALAAANDAADEEATVLHHARQQAVQGFRTRENNEDQQKKELLDELEFCLDDNSRQKLDDLAQTSAALGALNAEPKDLAQGIIELTKEEFRAQEQLSKVEELHDYLRRELTTLREQLKELTSDPAYETPVDLPALTAEWSRGTRLLMAKVGEYNDRITLLERNKSDGPTLADLKREEEDVTTLVNTVQYLESRVKLFHDLPKDVSGGRAKYRELEQELALLIQQRDSMFENLVDRG